MNFTQLDEHLKQSTITLTEQWLSSQSKKIQEAMLDLAGGDRQKLADYICLLIKVEQKSLMLRILDIAIKTQTGKLDISALKTDVK